MTRTVAVALLPCELPSTWSADDSVAVVIDTLRFTSTACTALAAGARSVRVVSQVEQARQLATSSGTAERPLLCGERHCLPIDGFDLGNSPSEYSAGRVADRDLIFSTTNGTVAVEAAQAARQLLLGSLLNRAALVQWLQAATSSVGEASPIWLVCAGTDGQVALEDVIAAGAILELLDWQLANDSAWLAFNCWQYACRSGSLVKELRFSRGGANLIAAGLGADIEAALHVDSLRVVPGQVEPGCFKALTLA